MTSTPRFFKWMLWVHWRSLVSTTRGVNRRSVMLGTVLAVFIVTYLLLGYFLFYHGLRYLQNLPVIGVLIDQRILFLVLAFFFVMLIFSHLIVGYATLFRNRESAWLLTLPVPPELIYRWKFLEALVVSSWAFVFLSAPMMAAYGHVHGAGGLFYLLTALAYLPFLLIAAAAGSWLLILFVRLLSRWTLRPVHLILVGLLVLAGLMLLRPATTFDAVAAQEVLTFNQLLQHTRFTLHPLLPSYWLGTSIQAWTSQPMTTGLIYAGALTANGLMALLLTFAFAGRFFYGGWNALFTRQAVARHRKNASLAHRKPGLMERLFHTLPFPSRPVKALVLKDARVFWRDPAQWSQFTIFFGLLAIYILNLRNISYEYQSEFWSTLISFLNLGASALTLSTLTTRFVYPQFSLEGKRLWILGLAPIGLDRLLMHKFWISTVSSGLITLTLMVASSLMLELEAGKVVFFAITILIMSMSLSGLAVGLGAIFPNFREDNPSKIVSGFGGTLCLVISFFYVTAFIALMAYPSAAGLTRESGTGSSPAEWTAFASAILLSLAVLFIPMKIALRTVKNLEI